MANSTITTQCCIAGGGPAGMMLGFLLARAGVQVVVLEKHADFFRDFRGDTVHPSTLELMDELGLLDEFLKLPHQKVETLSAQIGAEHVRDGRFSPPADALQIHRADAAMGLPQFPGRARQALHEFDLRMQAEATDLIEENGRVVGLIARTPDGTLTIRADLVVGCDGRHSIVREKAGFESEDYGAPMDVLWFRLSHKDGDSAGHVRPCRSRQDDGHARSRRLLAVRLCHPERRHRADEVGGPRSLPRDRSSRCRRSCPTASAN